MPNFLYLLVKASTLRVYVKKGMFMNRTLKIGRYEIVDADTINGDEVAIPCLTNPALSYQLDGWDQDTSIPAWIDGKPVDLEIGHYDKQQDRWVLKIPA